MGVLLSAYRRKKSYPRVAFSFSSVARGGFLSLRPRLQVELFSNFREENAPKYAPLLALYLLPALFAGIGILSNVIVRNIEVAEREYERLQGDV